MSGSVYRGRNDSYLEVPGTVFAGDELTLVLKFQKQCMQEKKCRLLGNVWNSVRRSNSSYLAMARSVYRRRNVAYLEVSGTVFTGEEMLHITMDCAESSHRMALKDDKRHSIRLSVKESS